MEAETDFMKIRHFVIDTVATNGNLPVRFPPTRKRCAAGTRSATTSTALPLTCG